MTKENLKLDKSNVEQQKAFDLVANTNTCLFITGKAGTGKTTFIKRIQEEINKNFLVLAPTGIAVSKKLSTQIGCLYESKLRGADNFYLLPTAPPLSI